MLTIQWRKSSQSNSAGCLGARFAKSSSSSHNGGCLGAAFDGMSVYVIDTKQGGLPDGVQDVTGRDMLEFSPQAWLGLITRIKTGSLVL